LILINGKPENSISVSDRGLQYGDGLFETIACRDGHAEFLAEHMQRLALGCERLKLPKPDISLISTEIAQLLAQQANAVIKVMITRGQGGRGYRSLSSVSPNRIISLHPYPDYPETHQEGITVRCCDFRLGHNPALAGIKHLNRLEQVMARNEWHDSTIAEGLMQDIDGYFVEGTMTNLFMVRAGKLITPPIDNSGIAGIMRAQIKQLAVQQGLGVMEQCLTQTDLEHADELFVTNSLIGIWPVTNIVDLKLSLPHGVITKQLQHALISVQR